MLGAISKLRQRDTKTVSFVILRKVSSCLVQKGLERSQGGKLLRVEPLFSLFFSVPLFPFSSCSFFLPLCTYFYTHTRSHTHRYIRRSSDEKTDLLAVSARNAGQGVAKNCRRVQRKLEVERE